MGNAVHLPTAAEMTLAYALCGRTFRGGAFGLQAKLSRWICGEPNAADLAETRALGLDDEIWLSPYNLIQVCRQSFKTETTSLHDAVGVLNGNDCGFGMPSKQQSAAVTHRRIIGFMEQFERLGLAVRRGRGYPQHFCDWDVKLSDGSWGIGTLSLVGARAAVESQHRKSSQTGRTFSILHLGEGQSMYSEDVAELDPSVLVALAEGRGRYIIEGVGGPSDSVIEARKTGGKYRQFWCDSAMFLAENPEFTEGHEQLAHDNTEEWTDANLGCKPMAAGRWRIFPAISPLATPPAHFGNPLWLHAIDVGRSHDYTCIAHMCYWPVGQVEGMHPKSIVHVVAFTQIPHGNLVDQARWVHAAINDYPWGYRGQGVSCETNAEHGLCDILEKSYFPKIRGVNINQSDKDAAINAMRVEAREMRLQMSPEAQAVRVGNPPQVIGDLGFRRTERGAYDWDHHDGLSALVVGWQDIGGEVRYPGKSEVAFGRG